VSSVSPSTGTLVALGITVETKPLTRLSDESAIERRPFGLQDLVAGDYVHVVGAESPEGSGIVVASLLERHDPQDETRLQGFLRPLTTPYAIPHPLPILGVTVHTNAETRYPTPYGGYLGEGTFFFDLEPKQLLDVRGVEAADRTIVASEVRYVDWITW
jgi:hypothetical protein